jgi:hypothetical protein
MKRILLAYSLPAALFLGGALPLAFVASFGLTEVLPMHGQTADVAQVAAGLVILGLCGGLWGRSVARAAGSAASQRLFWVSAVTFIVAVIAAVVVLGLLERLFVEDRALGPVPIHIIFAAIFPPAVFVVTTVMCFVVGGLLRGWRFGTQLAWRAGLAAAAAFFVADVVQDLLGRRVGGPNAAATATMITVLMIGNLCAALAAGTALGWQLTRAANPAPTPPHLRPNLVRSPPRLSSPAPPRTESPLGRLDPHPWRIPWQRPSHCWRGFQAFWKRRSSPTCWAVWSLVCWRAWP